MSTITVLPWARKLALPIIFPLAFASLASHKTYAEEFPNKPIEMTVLFGGSANAIGHLLADLMSEELDNPVVAVSRTGGGGALGYTYVQGTRPDGYNLVFNSNSISTSHHRGNIPFDYTSFDPVARISIEVPAVAVRAERDWNSLQDLKHATQTNDDKLKVGISGRGSFTHIASAALFESMGISDKVTYMPFGKGKAPVELLAGRIDVALQWPSQFKSYADAGKLEILSVTSAERIPLLPDVPTAKEQGFDLDIAMWRGLSVPAGTPPERIQVLQDAAKEAIQSKEFQEASQEIGFETAYLPANEFGELIKSDDSYISELMASLNLKR